SRSSFSTANRSMPQPYVQKRNNGCRGGGCEGWLYDHAYDHHRPGDAAGDLPAGVRRTAIPAAVPHAVVGHRRGHAAHRGAVGADIRRHPLPPAPRRHPRYCRSAPRRSGGPLPGARADRLRPRPLITVGYGLEAGVAAALALAGLPAGASLALVAAIACLTPVFAGASSRLIAEALTGDAYVLGRSLANIATSAAQLLGLAAGGATVAALGARHALLVTAAGHLVAAAAIWARLPGLPAAAAPPGQPRVSVLRQSWAVNRQLATDPAVRVLLLATWLPPAFLTAAESLIVPYAAQHYFAASSPGLMLACVPAGMIV